MIRCSVLGVVLWLTTVGGDAPTAQRPGPCADERRLACTGLYEGAAGRIARGVRPFTPGYRLWSDGLEKSRYIALPPGAKIDTSNVDDWTFPVGTKVWKEFRWHGRRIETRYLEKRAAGNWRRTTFAWNESGTEALEERAGRTITLPGSSQRYDIPAENDCARCHDGRADSVLGFEVIALAAPDASGLTLERLDAEALVTQPVTARAARIGGSRATSDALGWLHVNCGVSCHNPAPSASASFLGLDLKVPLAAAPDPTRAPVVRTAFDQPTKSLGFRDATAPRLRVVPGRPEESAVFARAASRAPTLAMPPLASHVVDQEGVAKLRAWITSLDRAARAGERPGSP
jgi:hypothetical protein